MSKSIAKSSIKELNLDNEMYLLQFANDSTETKHFEKEIDNTYIQLHFCLEGNAKFHFNKGNYILDVLEHHSILLYNPQQELPINLEISPKTALISLIISIEKFHSLFSKEANHIHFLSKENIHRKYYNDDLIKPTVLIVLQQILNSTISSAVQDLFIKGKIYELLSLHFQKDEASAIDYCPFLVDEQNVIKIRKAKDIIISKMSEPPSLQELATEIDLNLNKLKQGFKQIYGDTVYSFLFDYKMEHARKLLESNRHNVNEVGLKVGYSTASHFIAAFKKKFGTTPKRYVNSL